ncbi:NmrA domain-containing protein [Fusarium falciforme]|uniref:NmrA domain-containing protein n=1 Tax=Fusarium falciforme TaxID=195108 RepID=UPI0023007AA0|nr:NmrA domain-containing protein [Fusarium falciforme]WAO97327.1 NmrA domain-containing protein [Fusarium falciforme]
MWSMVAPPKNVMKIRDAKEDIINHLKKIGLPFSIIDIGFWYEIMIPRVDSGRSDHIALYSKYFFVDESLFSASQRVYNMHASMLIKHIMPRFHSSVNIRSRSRP